MKIYDPVTAAQAAYLLDEEMSSIREEIQEAQRLFSQGMRGPLEATTKLDHADFGSLDQELEQDFLTTVEDSAKKEE